MACVVWSEFTIYWCYDLAVLILRSGFILQMYTFVCRKSRQLFNAPAVGSCIQFPFIIISNRGSMWPRVMARDIHSGGGRRKNKYWRIQIDLQHRIISACPTCINILKQQQQQQDHWKLIILAGLLCEKEIKRARNLLCRIIIYLTKIN